MTAQYHVIPSGGIQCNSVVVWDDATREAVLIDPTDDASDPLEWIQKQQLNVQSVLLTHGHFDHSGDAERASTVLGRPLYLHPADRDLYRSVAEHAQLFGCHADPPRNIPEPLADGSEIRISDSLILKTLHVPGHSRGGVAFYLADGPWVFSGDTLFRGSVGRTDLPGGSMTELTDSIRNKLYQLPDACIVVAGHGPETTIGAEKRHNSFIRA